MAEETKVEQPTKQNATVETTAENEVDYEKELEVAAEKQKNAEFAARRIAKKQEVEEPEVDPDEKLLKKFESRILPKLQATAESNALEIHLKEVAGDNESQKRLIRFHLDNTVNKDLPLRERVEAAYAIANKKLVDKTVKEINIAQQNRSQLSTVGQGSNQETYAQPGNNVLSENQINDLKAKHAAWKLPGSADDFVKNTIKRLSQ